MKNETGTWGLILGGLVALAAVLFIFSDGSLGGKTTVSGDRDLPPIATARAEIVTTSARAQSVPPPARPPRPARTPSPRRTAGR